MIMLRTKQVSQVLKRFFSAQTQVAQDGQSVVYSKLNNGLKVATCNHDAPGSHIALLVKTGSRDDAVTDLGLTHCLQVSAGLTSSKNTAFLTSQLLAHLGSDLEVTAGREFIIYNMGCFETAASELVLDVLSPAILGAKFPWWEVRDLVDKRMQFQKAYAENNPLYVLMESLHKASFRGSLGNTVLSPDYMIGKHTTDMLTSRFNSKFSLDNMVLAGSGISHDALKTIAENVEGLSCVSQSPVKRDPATFISSEVHVDRFGDELSYVALGFPGVPFNDPDALTLSVLQLILGTPTNIRGGSGIHSGVLHKAVSKCSEIPESTSAFSFSINYSDCGLFGVTITAPREKISETVSSVSSLLQTISRDGVGKSLVDAAKRKLQSRILMDSESAACVGDLAYQASVLDCVVSPQQMSSMVDKITPDNVTAIARRILTGKRSIATVGQTYPGPLLQDF